jgi:hypothetical protein
MLRGGPALRYLAPSSPWRPKRTVDQFGEPGRRPDNADAPSSIRTLRWRLQLALLTMAIVPIALVMSLASATVNALLAGNPVPIEPVAVMVGLAALLVVVAIWTSGRVLRPA